MTKWRPSIRIRDLLSSHNGGLVHKLKYLSIEEDSVAAANARNNNQASSIVANDLDDYINHELGLIRLTAGVNTTIREIKLKATDHAWREFLISKFSDYQVSYFNKNNGIAITTDEVPNYICFYGGHSNLTIRIHGDNEFVSNIAQLLLSKFDEVSVYIEWVFSPDGQSTYVPLEVSRLPCNEMYPWLNGEDLSQYYDRFMASSANVLLLIGPPGTGKTTFIRGLLHHINSSALVTYDPSILAKDAVFSRFMDGEHNIMLLEDADEFLGSRKTGNNMMHKFLNVGDGLVSMSNKKLIFSTNLPNISDVDSALTRPGRCFDIVEFSELNINEATVLAGAMKKEFTPVAGKNSYSVADISTQNPSQAVPKLIRGFGFS
jgi:hypothetical protein